MESEHNSVSRKIVEAYYINIIEPGVNGKNECLDLKRFLIQRSSKFLKVFRHTLILLQ